MIKIDYCPICKSKNIEVIRKIEYCYPEKILNYYIDRRLKIVFDSIFKYNREDILLYEVNRCKDCQFIFLNPRLNDEETLKIYDYLIEGHKFKTPKTENISPFDSEKERRIREMLGKYIDKEARIILDYGGCDGRMCINLRNKYKCEIIDIVKYILYEGIEYLGNNIKHIENKQYDVILLSHILEHLSYPLELILDLKKNLKYINGIILISVPCGYISEWKDGIKEPLTHCNFFSQPSLKKCLSLAGYQLMEIKEYGGKYKEIYIIGAVYD